MAKKISNISFMPVVETISRKFALRRETCSTKTNQQGQTSVFSYMGSGTRMKRFNGGLVNQNYFFMRKIARQTEPSSDEMNARASFTEGVRWAKAAAHDLSALSHNQLAFAESSKTGKTIKDVWAGDYTFNGFLRAVAIKMANDGETLPQNHQLPAFDA